MNSPQKILYPLMACLLGFMSSCGTQKEIVVTTNDFKVKSAFLQEYVSGTEGGRGKVMLSIEVELLNLEPKSMDSLEYKGAMYPINVESFILNLNLRKGRELVDADPMLSATKAAIYYHEGEKVQKFLVDPIVIKDPIFLP
ncbi:MAG: hypothetical protein ACJASQ_000847 [Crocinitomicaceae bacterium]|jgi:hypothetical protein